MTKPTNARKLEQYTERMPNGCLEWTRGRFWKNGIPTYGAIIDVDNGKTRGAHCVAWEEAHGPIPTAMMVCHHCDNPPCCDPAHLFLGTAGDNQRDMVAKGRKYLVPAEQHVRGSAHHRAKLNETQVAEILRRLEGGRHGIQTALASEYGVSLSTIHLIKTGRNWRQISQPV